MHPPNDTECREHKEPPWGFARFWLKISKMSNREAAWVLPNGHLLRKGIGKKINTRRVDVQQECVCPIKKNGLDTFKWTVPAQAADAV